MTSFLIFAVFYYRSYPDPGVGNKGVFAKNEEMERRHRLARIFDAAYVHQR
jgi:hypothetical protein